MKITSSAFEDKQTIPAKYTCAGENINPPLVFSEIPKQAKSLVLVMDDIDVPKKYRADGLWNHWLIWNMPAETKGIGEGMTPPGIQGHSTGGETVYQGPCPPPGTGQHRYIFRLYALDTSLDLDTEKTRREDLLKAMKGHILDSDQLEGRAMPK